MNRQGACPLDCSGHGQCLRSGRCRCEERWKGPGCSEPICPANCSHHGYCDIADRKCNCARGHTGIDCSIEATRGHWESMGKVSSDGQASHSAVVVGQYMWTVGGYTFNEVLLNLTR
ncbi:hypothetical protein NP493_601g02013 [Ridgeia piscesae]|uniref:EGF-like domain-containing protein n=1 Tax=Ridgeia piscesae TaxID=27915 RepID=A0AAD9KTR8_RIDPI|nr:hypothetical protein NP493_601g02013 [Ridgeia piscesae]